MTATPVCNAHAVTGLRIRAAVPADSPAVAQLLTELGYPSDEAFAADRLRAFSSRATEFALVAEEQGKILGVLALHLTPLLTEAEPQARIVALCVAKECRGRGIGRKLVEEAERIARAHGCKRLELTSHKNRQDAHAFYERLGFQEHCRHYRRDVSPVQAPAIVSASDPASLLQTAVAAARAAGEVQMRHFCRSAQIEQIMVHDLKSDVDRLAEEAIRAKIRAMYPDHAILSEECGLEAGRNYLWIVDPLDGTVNYCHGIPYFCASVACYRLPQNAISGADALPPGATGEAAAIFAPACGEMYAGAPGVGVALNGERVAVAGVDELCEAVISITFGSNKETIHRMLEMAGALAHNVRKIRTLGATALDIARVAAGGLGGAVQPCVRLWDFAAARILLEEAGGKMEAIEIATGRYEVLSAAPGLFHELRHIIWPNR